MYDRFIHEALLARPSLHNQYEAMRHGRAGSNEKSILMSSRDPRYGLIAAGQEMVRAAAARLAQPPFLIVASDTPRGAETGSLMQETLAGQPVLRFDKRLRERFWGDHEGTAEANCLKVYAHDRLDPETNPDKAEPVGAMLKRLSSLIVDLESEFTGRRILLVSHWDPLLLLHVVFTGAAPGHYSELPEFACAEIRPMIFTPRKTAAEAAVPSSLIGARGDARLAAFEL